MIIIVIRASNVLNIDELQLFNLAYRYWFNRKAEARYIKTAFAEYLHKQVAPPWVVHFARSVLQDYNAGNFDPTRFGIHPAYEELPLGWSLVFQTPLSLPLNDADNILIA